MIAAGALKLSASAAYVLASLQCPATTAPRVELKFDNVAPRYTADRTSAELGRFHIDTTFSHGPTEVFSVGGLTESHIESGFKMGFKMLTDPGTKNGCVWVDSVNIEVRYAPLVRIAKDFRPGTCHYDITTQHELRHVNTDVITLNEYLPKLKDAVKSITQGMGVQGPMSQKEMEDMRKLFIDVVRGEVEKQAAAMERVRFMRQQQIDTRAEYLRLSKSCPALAR
jgi:hypothetical protein